MHVGLQVQTFTYPGGAATLGSTFKDIVRTADDGGFYSLWVMDHFFQIQGVGPAENEMLEGYSALSFAAAVTSRVKLGTMVTGVIYRYPGILVKTVTTLDVLSGGRAYLGIGAAWFEREALGLGVPYPPTAERFERLEETLQIAKQMWSGSTAPYQGRHYQLAETLTRPLPLSQPHPPILIGGMGERKTLRLVARYADACNFFLRSGDDVLTSRLDTLKRYCDEEGRPYDAIEKTTLASIAPGEQSTSEIIDLCRHAADMGFSHIIFNMANPNDITPLEIIAREVIPAVAAF